MISDLTSSNFIALLSLSKSFSNFSFFGTYREHSQCPYFLDRGLFRCGRPNFLLQKPTSNFSKFSI